ncbi:MAG: hypothetical protein ACO24H_07620 [Polynucleobacter sp.]
MPPPVMGGAAPRLHAGSKNTAHIDMLIDPIEENQKQDRLDSWFMQDGRDKKGHEFYMLYTGLADKYMNKEESSND